MKVIRGHPPNFDKIRAAFPGAVNPGVLFAYGDTIYTNAISVSPALMAHEEVHQRQQEVIGGPEPWWDRYIADKEFRFAMELEAHLVEYATIVRSGANRNARRLLRSQIAKRLSGALYGHMISYGKAVAHLRVAEEHAR